MNKKITKTVFIFILLLTVFTMLPILNASAESGNVCAHPDADNDNVCDECGERLIAYFAYADFYSIEMEFEASAVCTDVEGNETVLSKAEIVNRFYGRRTLFSGKTTESRKPEKINIHLDTWANEAHLDFDLYFVINTQVMRLEPSVNRLTFNTDPSELTTYGDAPVSIHITSPTKLFDDQGTNMITDVDFIIDYEDVCLHCDKNGDERCDICGSVFDGGYTNRISIKEFVPGEELDEQLRYAKENFYSPVFAKTIDRFDFCSDIDAMVYIRRRDLTLRPDQYARESINAGCEITFDCYCGNELIFADAAPDEEFCTTLPVTAVKAKISPFKVWTCTVTSYYICVEYSASPRIDGLSFELTEESTNGYRGVRTTETKPVLTGSEEMFTFGAPEMVSDDAHPDSDGGGEQLREKTFLEKLIDFIKGLLELFGKIFG